MGRGHVQEPRKGDFSTGGFCMVQCVTPKETKNTPKYWGAHDLQNESFPNFSIFRPEFCPEFCSEFSPNFLSFRASFCGRRRPEKIHQKSPPFFNAKFPGKFEEKIHKMFLESGQVKVTKYWGAHDCGNPPSRNHNQLNLAERKIIS